MSGYWSPFGIVRIELSKGVEIFFLHQGRCVSRSPKVTQNIKREKKKSDYICIRLENKNKVIRLFSDRWSFLLESFDIQGLFQRLTSIDRRRSLMLISSICEQIVSFLTSCRLILMYVIYIDKEEMIAWAKQQRYWRYTVQSS